MKVKPSKCEFQQNETEYLGYIIGQEGVKTDPIRTQAIWDWITPKKIKEIQCFLGFCNLYRRFIEGFCWTAKPLYAKTECIGNCDWGDKEQQGFNELRTKITTAQLLVYFDPLARTKIETDASKIWLLWYTVIAMPGRKMETSGVLIQDNIGRRMQLRHTR